MLARHSLAASIKRQLLHTSTSRATLWSFLDTPEPASVYSYAHQNSLAEPEHIRQIRLSTVVQNPAEAQKTISPLQGAFLSHIVHMQSPQHVLELGCYKGYSACWLAHALTSIGCASASNNHHLWTCERDPAVAEIATRNIDQAGYSDIVTVLPHPAQSVLESWHPSKKLDLVFIDANKSAYKLYYDLILERDLLSDNGQIIVDNVLLHGRVHCLDFQPTEAAKSNKKSIASKINNFNSYVAQDPRTSQILLPLFDGLLLIRKSGST
ncbi:hypothetical protein FB639_002549 [Coemansia asiatica]|nr:hypothetical protein FB639_002549 [Coemansia asiatica]